jgi:hypothetical protein
MSNSSFKTGLDCKHCNRHSATTTVTKQWGENKANDLVPIANLALRVNNIFVCCKCGAKIGTDDDKHMPARVGEIIGILLQQCLFRIDSVTDQDVGQPFIWLSNRALSGARCQVRWFRDERWIEGLPERKAEIHGQDYDASSLHQRPPAMIELALRALTESHLTLTEMPKNGAGYAYLATTIKGYETLLASPADPLDFDLDNPRAPENPACPLIVQVHLQWSKADQA